MRPRATSTERARNFLRPATRPPRNYNLGIVHLAERDYAAAADAFEQAITARPAFTAAKDARARRAGARADGQQLTETMSHDHHRSTFAAGTSDMPPAPTTPEEAGLSLDLLIQLALKTLHFAGELTGDELARRLGLNFSVIEPAVDFLKTQRHVEIAGGAMIGRASYRFRITDAGRARAALFLEANHYVGVAPVPFEQYRRYMLELPEAAPRTATRDRVRDAFKHLVISQRVLDQLGPAINAGHSMFVYGPPGNGKTVISQAVRKLLDGEIAIPHAIEVEGHIIRFFDPVNHEPVASSRR